MQFFQYKVKIHLIIIIIIIIIIIMVNIIRVQSVFEILRFLCTGGAS